MNNEAISDHQAPPLSDAQRIDQHGSPEKIERQIDERRSRISRQLDELEERLSPRQLLEQGMDLFKGQGGEVANNLGRSFRDNPAPFIITGVGLAWLMSATSHSSDRNHRSSDRGYRYYDEFDDDYDQYDRYDSGSRRSQTGAYSSDHAYDAGSLHGRQGDSYGSHESDKDGIMDKVAGVAEEVGDRASDMVDSATEKMDQGRMRAAEKSRRFRGEAQHRMQKGGRQVETRARRGALEVSDYFQEQPLVGGLLGLAAGALIGSLLPPSDVENRMMGEQSDKLKHQAADRAEKGAEQAREKIESAASDASRTAQNQLDEKKSSTTRVEQAELS